MWNYETSIATKAAAARIWSVFCDVEGWRSWNPGIERIKLHGPFTNGTTFSMKPPGQDELTSTLIEVMPERGFTDETNLGDVRVVVKHAISEFAAGQRMITYSALVMGPDAEEIGKMVTSDFPEVLAALKQLAEQT